MVIEGIDLEDFIKSKRRDTAQSTDRNSGELPFKYKKIKTETKKSNKSKPKSASKLKKNLSSGNILDHADTEKIARNKAKILESTSKNMLKSYDSLNSRKITTIEVQVET